MGMDINGQEIALAVSLVKWVVEEIRRYRNSDGPALTDEEIARLEDRLRNRLLASTGADKERWTALVEKMKEEGDHA